MGRYKKIDNISKLKKIANELRADVIEMLLEAGSGHFGGPLGLAEIFAVLYFYELNHDPKNSEWIKRDRLFLSCGHVCPIRYVAMIKAGYLPVKHLKTLRKLGSKLQGHPSYLDWKALEHSSGSLGQGLSVAVGGAISDKMDKKERFNYCVLSDGEQQEGQIWEAAMLADKMKLNNLICLLDRNNIQISGETKDVLPIESLAKKWKSFNWHVEEINGNDIKKIIKALKVAKKNKKPSMIICNTVLGKGVPFMENDYKWHGMKSLTKQQTSYLREIFSK